MSYGGSSFQDSITDRNYSIDIGQFLSRGWQIFTSNPGGFIGFLFLTVVISFVLSNIPVIGGIANGIISGILGAGYYFVSFKIAKRSTSEFSDFFKGFNNTYFMPLFLANLVIGLFVGLFSLAATVAMGISFFNPFRNFIAANGGDVTDLPELPIPDFLPLPLLIIGVLLLLPAIYLGVAYTFAIPLIVDRKLPFWEAMETSRQLITKKWLAFFGFTLVLFFINFAGLLVCGLGLILTAPLTICAIAAAYEAIVGLSGNGSNTDLNPVE